MNKRFKNNTHDAINISLNPYRSTNLPVTTGPVSFKYHQVSQKLIKTDLKVYLPYLLCSRVELHSDVKMKLIFAISIFITLLNIIEGKADWDTFDKYRQLIGSQGIVLWKPCDFNRDVVFDFRQALYNVTIETFKKISALSNSHLVFSPYSLWLTLGAIAEGTSGTTYEELSNLLQLPQDECAKKQYYQIASTLEPASEDVLLSRSSTLILDDSNNLNIFWENFVRSKSLISTSSAPLKANPVEAADLIRRVLKLQLPVPNFEGSSIIVDTLNFEGLWTDAFSDAIIEKSPFYNDVGKKIGYVDLMKTKKRVKMAYLPALNAKILELPVGFGSRYRMLFSLSLGTTQVKNSVPNLLDSVFFEILDSFKESFIPLEVAIPRFRMTTEIDMRHVLEEMGIQSLWTDPEGTR